MKKIIRITMLFIASFIAISAFGSQPVSADQKETNSTGSCYVFVEKEGEEAVQKAVSGEKPTCYESLSLRSSSTVTGIDYRDANYQGDSLTLTTTDPNGCNTGSSYKLDQMPNGWNSGISSAKGFGGCNSFYHYDWHFQNGAVLECSPNCASMGLLDDQTSSVRMAP